MPRPLLAVLALAAAPSSVWGTQARGGTLLIEEVLVRRISRPVFMEPKRPGGCDAVPSTAVVVKEDGAVLRVAEVSREALPTLHVLLLDTSHSMINRFYKVRTIGEEYLLEIPEEEAAMVLAFSDDLALLTPPTVDRGRLQQDLQRLRPGVFTTLWDSLHATTRYLEAREERKALILLSDGRDSRSSPWRRLETAVDLVMATDNLTIFSIGIEVPANPRGRMGAGLSGSHGASYLRRIAQDTGGKHFRIRSGKELPGVLAAIRERLNREGFVTYEAPPFGEGPRDNPRESPFRWRNVHIAEKRGVPCDIRPAGSTLRLEGRHPVQQPEAPLQKVDGALQTVDLSRPWPFFTYLVLPWAEKTAAGSDRTTFILKPERVEGVFPDLVLERGLHFAVTEAGKVEMAPDRQPLLVFRPVQVMVPLFPRLEKDLRSVADVFLWLLLHGEGDQGEWRERYLVHGGTFLEMRKYVGQALYSYQGYREWTDVRMESTRRQRVKRFLESYRRDGEVPEERLQAVEKAILSQPPEWDEPQHYLAEWLADVKAKEVATALEARLANLLLQSQGRDAVQAMETVQQAKAYWDILSRWLAPVSSVRVLTPLVPSLEPERDVIGFYRILLPSPDPTQVARILAALVPEHPMGLQTVEWLLQEPSLEPLLKLRFQVTGVRYPRPALVVVDLAEPGDAATGFSIGAHFLSAGGRKDPLCLFVMEGEAAGEAAPGIGAAITAALAQRNRECRRSP